jgi:hypothetical protein
MVGLSDRYEDGHMGADFPEIIVVFAHWFLALESQAVASVGLDMEAVHNVPRATPAPALPPSRFDNSLRRHAIRGEQGINPARLSDAPDQNQ